MPANPTIEKKRIFPREPFSSLSHLAGMGLALIALPVLLSAVLPTGEIGRLIGTLIYGVSLILLYGASALYHGANASAKVLGRLLRLDHIAIFLLIVGTYAPLCLGNLRGPVGWSLLAAEGTLAALGILLSILGRTRGHEVLRLSLYLVMGWLAVFAIQPLREAVSPAGLAWLLAGGLAYSLGAIIFATNRPHLWPGKFSAHDLWHVFVLAGSVLHFVFIFRFVIH